MPRAKDSDGTHLPARSPVSVAALSEALAPSAASLASEAVRLTRAARRIDGRAVLRVEALAQGVLDLAVEGKPAPFVAGVDEISVQAHVEGAATTRLDLGLQTDGVLDRGRQTGGPWLVVSNDAVFDGDPRHG